MKPLPNNKLVTRQAIEKLLSQVVDDYDVAEFLSYKIISMIEQERAEALREFAKLFAARKADA